MQFAHLNPRDGADLGLRQRMKDHRFVDPVDEFGAELTRHDLHHRLAHGLVVLLAGQFLDQLAAQVRRHHDHGVAKIHRAPVAVGQPPVVEHLQQDVEHIAVRLLDLVEQDHGVGLAAYGFRQVPALFITDIAGRGADQPRHRMALHELGHVDTHHGLFGVEQEGGDRLAQLRLAHAGRTEEQERADRTCRIGQARARTPDRVRHGRHRLVLADHALVQRILHAQQLLALGLEHAIDRNAGPARYDFGDFLVGHVVAQQLGFGRLLLGRLRLGEFALELRDTPVLQFRHAIEIAGALGRLELLLGLLEFLALVGRAGDRCLFRFPDLFQIRIFAFERGDLVVEFFQPLLRALVGLLGQRLFLDLELNQAPIETVQFFRLGVDLDTDLGGGLVDQVDRLVGQLAVGDIALRQLGRGDDRAVGNVHAVVDLVALLEPAQDRDGVFHVRLVDQHLLEAALQRGVLFDVLAIFIERGRADAVQLAARQRRFEHVAGVHRAFRLAGAHEGMDLVDEQDDAAFLLGQVGEHALETVLELAAILRAGDHAAEIEHEHTLVAQRFGHLAVDDALCQAFHDRGLAHTGVAHEGGVVLGPAREHLNHAADFLVAADHRVELALFGTLGEVDGVLVEGAALLLGVGVVHVFAAANLVDLCRHVVARGAGFLEDPPGLGLVLERGEHEQFAGDERVTALLRELVGQIEYAYQRLAGTDIAGGLAHGRQVVERLEQAIADIAHVQARAVEQRAYGAAFRIQEGEQDVQRLDFIMVTADGQALGLAECGLQLAGEFVHSHRVVPLAVVTRRLGRASSLCPCL